MGALFFPQVLFFMAPHSTPPTFIVDMSLMPMATRDSCVVIVVPPHESIKMDSGMFTASLALRRRSMAESSQQMVTIVVVACGPPRRMT